MSSTPFQPEGKTVVVTGGANGIGAALCIELATRNVSTIIVVDLNLDKAIQICETCQKKHYELFHNSSSRHQNSNNKNNNNILRAIPKQVDVTNEQQISTLISTIEHTIGPIDLFILNAGIMPPRTGPEFTGSTALDGIIPTPNEAFDPVFAVNFFQLVHVTRYLLPRYLSRRKGHFVITASAAAFSPIGSVSYAVSKSMAVSFAEWLAITYGNRNVGVCCACPMPVRTDMTGGMEGNPMMDVMGRVIEAEEVARCVLEALGEGRLMAYPHPEVETFVRKKGEDKEGWLRLMRRLNEKQIGALLKMREEGRIGGGGVSNSIMARSKL